MRTYAVQGKQPILDFVSRAIERSGGRVVDHPDPRSAPFTFRVLTAAGEVIELVCYAFLANKYQQAGRPKGEHRFQVKYGSDFHRYHRLHFDEGGRQITLMFGAHLEAGLFIAVDPSMHDPTWFSRSVEVPERQLTEARRTGWHGWERERSAVRRKIELPQQNFQTESILAFKPERFLDYVALERMTQRFDPGERLLLFDKAATGLQASRRGRHPLETLLGLDAGSILDVLGSRNRLLAAVRGYVAEDYLRRRLEETPGLTHVRGIDEDGKPDFSLRYLGREFLVECKNTLRRPSAGGVPLVDFQKTRASKADPCSRYYSPRQFDVLAACLHPVTERWEFTFRATSTMAPHPRCPGRLDSRVGVTGDEWSRDVRAILRRVAGSSR